jgi:hypothetical protein
MPTRQEEKETRRQTRVAAERRARAEAAAERPASEPRLVQVSATGSVGGKVQIIKYDVSSDYFVSQSRTYEIPPDWSEQDAIEFQQRKYAEIRDLVDALGQAEFDERWDQSYLSG